jgi:hypothetical protein
MVEIYTHRGISFEDASTIVGIMSKYKDFFVDVMMVEELGLKVLNSDDNPWRDGKKALHIIVCTSRGY